MIENVLTFTTAVLILFISLCIAQMCNWSVIHGIKRKPHLSVVWNWYHFVAIAILHQPRPMDSADINTRLQLSDTRSIPPMHGGFLLWSWSPMPCEKHGPRASITTKTSAFGLGFCLLSPSGHVFHTAWETMIKSYTRPLSTPMMTKISDA